MTERNEATARPRTPEVHHFNWPSEFLEKLTMWYPRGDPVLTGVGQGGVLYRGHADAGWKLIPPAFRDAGSGPFMYAGGRTWERGRGATNREQIRREARTLEMFATIADQNGLSLPEDSQSARATLRHYARDIDHMGAPETSRWPVPELLSLLALAQHSGVPTRLLDWSFDPRVAAYFAAQRAVTAIGDPRTVDRDAKIAVWMVDLQAFDTDASATGVARLMPQSRYLLVRAPTASNANLRAQRGVFSLYDPFAGPPGTGPASRTPSQDPDAPFEPSPLDEAAAYDNPSPGLTCFTLPAWNAREVLRLLEMDYIDGGSLFPGYDGVRSAMAERRAWQTWPSELTR